MSPEVAEAPPVQAPVPDPVAPAVLAVAPEPARGCPACGRALVDDQNWCLECGYAAPGRLGRRAGWPLAGSVIALTLLLASGAVAATYAAFSSDSRRAVSRTATVARVVPAVTPTEPNLPPGAAAPLPPTVHRHPTPSAPPAPLPTPVTPPKARTPKAPTVPRAPAPARVPKPRATAPVPRGLPAHGERVVLDTDAASTYNPDGNPPTQFGDPATAIDSDPATAWTADVGPSGKVGAGVALDLKSLQRVSSVEIRGTPGLTVEVYGAAGELPASITAPGLKHLATGHLADAKSRLTLRSASKRYRHLVIWIPRAPDGARSVKIAEVGLFR